MVLPVSPSDAPPIFPHPVDPIGAASIKQLPKLHLAPTEASIKSKSRISNRLMGALLEKIKQTFFKVIGFFYKSVITRRTASTDSPLPSDIATLKDKELKIRSEIEAFQTERKALINRGRELTKALAQTVLQDQPVQVLQGLPNPGCNCYLNAATQCIEASFKEDKSFLALIHQDLVLKPDESLAKLESRLSNWMPLKDEFLPEAVLEIRLAIETNNLKLAELENAATIDAVTKKILLLRTLRSQLRDLEAFNDAILFKWSWLILMRAKNFGSQAEIQKAMQLHHNVCFCIKRNTDFETGKNAQKDSAAYLMLWTDQLKMDTLVLSQKHAQYEGLPLHSSAVAAPFSIFSISIPPENELKKFGLQLTFPDLLKRYFREPVSDPDNPVRIDGVLCSKYIEENNFALDPPKVLFFQMKRFKSEYDKNSPGSNSSIPNGDYNPDTGYLDLADFFPNRKDGKTTARYKLKSFVQHFGSLKTGGHYISYVRDGVSWRACNDSHVSEPLDVSQVPFDKAFIYAFQLVS